MKIGEIVRDLDYPEGYRIASFNSKDCGVNSTIDCITLEDLNQFENWLTTQHYYATRVRQILNFDKKYKEKHEGIKRQ